MSFLIDEVQEAASVVSRLLTRNAPVCGVLGRRWQDKPPRLIVTCARGSSDHVATFAKYLIERYCGCPVASAAPSLSSLYARPLVLEGAVVLCISQSGRSHDLLAFVEQAREAGAETVAIVNDMSSPLAALAQTVLPMHCGVEHSVAATKTFMASLVAIIQLTAEWAGDDALRQALAELPADLAPTGSTPDAAAMETISAATSMFTLGRGLAFAIAGEAALKLKETCQIHAEAYSPAEVLHGPLAIVGAGFPVLAFLQNDASAPTTAETLQRLEAAGARLHSFGESACGATMPTAATKHPVTALVAQIQQFYLLAEACAHSRGLDPDHPRNLRKVTISR